MGSRNTKLKRALSQNCPPGKESFDGFLNQSRGYLKHMLEGLDPEEIIEILAECVEEQQDYPNSIEGRRVFLEERMENLQKKMEQLERAEKQY